MQNTVTLWDSMRSFKNDTVFNFEDQDVKHTKVMFFFKPRICYDFYWHLEITSCECQNTVRCFILHFYFHFDIMDLPWLIFVI